MNGNHNKIPTREMLPWNLICYHFFLYLKYKHIRLSRKANIETVAQRYSVKKVFLEISQNSQEHICTGVSFFIKLQAEACNFFKKEALAQMISCEFCEIFPCMVNEGH